MRNVSSQPNTHLPIRPPTPAKCTRLALARAPCAYVRDIGHNGQTRGHLPGPLCRWRPRCVADPRQGRVGPRDASARTRGAPLVRTVQGGAGQRVGCKGRRDCFCSPSSSRHFFPELGPVLRVRRVRIRVLGRGTSAGRSTAGARRADDQTANDQRTFSTYMNVRGFCGPGGSRVRRERPWGLPHDCGPV